MGELAKAEDSMKKIETRLTGRDRKPYHYLVSLYANIGNKEETYRVWNIYKAAFPTIPNLGYHAMVSSLVRLGDILGAEEVYKEWLSVRTSLDPKIGNVLMGFYVKEGDMGKAEILLDQMIELGGKPNASSWEILAEGHIRERRISEAFACFVKAFSSERLGGWKLRPINVTGFFQLCEEEGDLLKKEALIGLLRQSNFLENQRYASLVGLSSSNTDIPEDDRVHGTLPLPSDDEPDSGGDLLTNQLQGTAM
ncbi:hypothetical protein MLD38_010873 [Melastoma candidum]|nr:hypothetical protein MLD38_010873 [Melastoma candidum]